MPSSTSWRQIALSRPVSPSQALKSGPSPSPSIGAIAAPEGPVGPLSPVAPLAPVAPVAPLVPVPCVTGRWGPRGGRRDGLAEAREPIATIAATATIVAFHDFHQALIQEVSAAGASCYMGRSGYPFPARRRIRRSD